MIQDFIDFVNRVLPYDFPSDVKDKAKAAIAQFRKDGQQLNYMMFRPLEQLSQGDIISNVAFVYFDDDGSQKKFLADAFVLSTSCHIDQKERILLAPIFPLKEFHGNILELKNNTIFNYMYIPDMIMADKFVAFDFINTYSKKLIQNCINQDKIQRLGSLNQIGYYFFIVKLAVYFMRKEDGDTLKNREN